MRQSKNFRFDGGAASFFRTMLLATLVTALTFGIAYPWALCMLQRWRCSHTYIEGRRLKFSGGGASLIGQWIKWFILSVLTFGIYSFWVIPNLHKWITEHTDFAD